MPTAYPRAYAYSKRILYIDQDFFAPIVQEMYDQSGELWKSMLLCAFYSQKPYEGYPARPLNGGKYDYADEWPFIPNWVMVDLQLENATAYDVPSGYKKPADWQQEWYFNEDVPSNRPEIHNPSYLIQSAR